VFFKRSSVGPATTAESAPSSPSTDDEAARLLDAVGSLMSSYIRGCFDLSHLPAADAQDQLERWRRHALLGTTPEPEPDAGTLDAGASAVGVNHRDWSGVTQAFAGHRVAERQFVEQALGDLREALWVCVERSHEAFMADRTADGAHQQQMERVRHALHKLETGAVKNEIEHAMEAPPVRGRGPIRPSSRRSRHGWSSSDGSSTMPASRARPMRSPGSATGVPSIGPCRGRRLSTRSAVGRCAW
jgi:hypothetical protein